MTDAKPGSPLAWAAMQKDLSARFPEDRQGCEWLEDIATSIIEMEKALAGLLLSAKVLRQNAEGCAVNHYGDDFQIHGMPGWLADCQRDIERAIAALNHVRGES